MVCSDITTELELDFMDAVRGGTHKVVVQKTGKCMPCKGRGWTSGWEHLTCSNCDGKGVIMDGVKCDECFGQGELRSMCRDCKGHGFAVSEATEKLNVPKGVNTGTVLRIKGQGNKHEKTKAGDICIKVVVRPHTLYNRDGCDITTSEKITLTQAILGAELEI